MADGAGARPKAVPAIDLQSVRVTLEYVYGDVKGVPQLKGVAAALKSALDELDRAGCNTLDPRFERLVGLPEGRFLR